MGKIRGATYNSKLLDYFNDYEKVLNQVIYYLDLIISRAQDESLSIDKNKAPDYSSIIFRMNEFKKEYNNDISEIDIYKVGLLKTEQETGISNEDYEELFNDYFIKYKGALEFLKTIYKSEYKILINKKEYIIESDSDEIRYFKFRIVDTNRRIDSFNGLITKIRILKNSLYKSQNNYDINWSWYNKVEFCIKNQSQLMTLNQIADAITQYEPSLINKKEDRRDLITTLSSICIQNLNSKRLKRTIENETTQYYYGLAMWFDPNTGKVIEDYLPNS